jgi:hypothetical protein
VDGPFDQVIPIIWSVVTAALLSRRFGGDGTSTHVAPFPEAEIPLSP